MRKMTGGEDDKREDFFANLRRQANITKSHIALQSRKASMRMTYVDKHEQQEPAVFARTVTAKHSNYCTFGIIQNHLNSILCIVHVPRAEYASFLDLLLPQVFSMSLRRIQYMACSGAQSAPSSLIFQIPRGLPRLSTVVCCSAFGSDS